MNPPGIPDQGVTILRTQYHALMDSTVTIKRPGVPSYNPTTGELVGTAGSTGYSGPAHIHADTTGTAVYSADSLEVVGHINVALPYDASPVPHEEDHVVITATDDAALIGRTLRIEDVSKGGLRVFRELTCTFIEPNPFDPLA